MTIRVKYWWTYGLTAGLVLLMVFNLSSPFAKGGMREIDKELALLGLLMGGFLLGGVSGLQSWAEKVLLPLLSVPLLLLLAVVFTTKLIDMGTADPEREPFNHELYCGLMYAATLVGFQLLLHWYKILRYTN